MNIEHVPAGTSEIIGWAKRQFGDGLYATSSFGADSALLLSVIRESGVDVPVITIDTGFWFPQTHEFMERLVNKFSVDLRVFGPSEEEVAEIKKTALWTYDLDEYNRRTKLEPMNKAMRELGAKALISGIRGDQTPNRSNLGFLAAGNHGETRIHPLIEWSREDVEAEFAAKGLPRHPLVAVGYESIGDWTLTRPGNGREGRMLGAKSECGLHLLPDGSLARDPDTILPDRRENTLQTS
ncbi:MAG TPA: phosphoadenylyl-sulfate reductase [Candidatus Saccharimonadales bacterium]|nr:phosphoadenylyl-sulfate reductase [Candidatus Saccharimonadales bacterium]